MKNRLKAILIKRYALLILLIGIHFFIYSQQWVDLEPFGNKSLGRTSFVSEYDGFIFIDNTLVHTSDGAITFDTVFAIADSQEMVLKFQMVDTMNGFLYKKWTNADDASDQKYYFMKTFDGGKSWIDITDTTNLFSRSYFYFLNKNIGFCTGYYTDSNMNFHTCIYKTITGGNYWYRVNDPLTDSREYYFTKKFHFIDSLHGWVACYLPTDAGFTLYTEDGGENWEYGIETTGDLFDIHFINLNTGGAVGRGAFSTSAAFTENNFQSLTYDYQSWLEDFKQYPYVIYYQNDSTVWVTGQPGKIYRSTDNGERFELFQDFPGHSFYKMQFFGKTGYLFSYSSIFKYSNDTATGNLMAISEKGKITIYPNPVNDIFTVEYSSNQHGMISCGIYNISGKQVFSDEILQNANTVKMEYNISNLKPGLYFFEIKNETQKYYSKIIKL